MAFIDEATVIGGPKPAAGTSVPVVKGNPRFVSDEQVTGISGFEQPESVPTRVLQALSGFGEPLPAYESKPAKSADPRFQSFVENAGGAATGITRERRRPPGGPDPTLAERGGQVLGTLAQASDMMTSVGKQVLGAAPYWAARNYTKHVMGASDEESAAAAQAAKDYFFPPEVSTPWARVAERLGPAAWKAYNENPIAWVMGKVGEVVEHGAGAVSEASGGRLQKQDVMAIADQFMGSVLWKQVKPKVQEDFKKRVDQFKAANPKAAEAAKEVDTSAAYDTNPQKEASGDLAQQKKDLDAKIKESQASGRKAAGLDKSAARDEKAAAKLHDNDPLKAQLLERAQVQRQMAAEARAAADNARTALEKENDLSAKNDERFGGTTYEVGSADTPEAKARTAEINQILEKPGFLRSPEEMIRLRGASQRGFSDPRYLAKVFGLTSLATAGALELWKHLDKDSFTEWLLKAKTGLGEMSQEEYEEQFRNRQLMKDFPNIDDYRRKENTPMPFSDAPGTLDRMPDNTSPKQFYTWKEMNPMMGAALAALGWVKVKGGMWHPEAVTRLSEPLKMKLLENQHRWYDTSAEELKPTVKAQIDWSDKAIRNYLNKHMGTEGDPLRDVVLPSGKTWGEVTDKVIGQGVREDYVGPGENAHPLYNVPRGETIWNVKSSLHRAEIEDYLSHVGDYLRQNVDPAKLQQMDFVRAVKETAKNDERVAKEMEKAAAASMKDMPVYKDYGNGMKWVELKLPEKLTEEQAKRIKKYPPEKDELHPQYGQDYAALDSNGNPIQNNYTGETATGVTPEEAHLAGQLAEEGNQMGHCVGGYCANVASGDTRILSLRDAKGRSHVTVEIAPNTVDLGAFTGNFRTGHVTRAQAIEAVKDLEKTGEVFRNGPENQVKSLQRWIQDLEKNYPEHPDILQIKGKQNRAPNPEYLPYVQDLVKGGKWGEVRDLENTGLAKYENRYLTHEEAGKMLQDRFNEIPPEERTAAARETIEQLGYWAKNPERGMDRLNMFGRQRGSADPKLLAGLAGVAGGALLGSYAMQNPLEGAILGALGGGVLATAKGRATLHDIIKSPDKYLGAISTRLGNMAPELKYRIRNHELRVLQKTEKINDAMLPFMQAFSKLNQQAQDVVARGIFNGDLRALEAIPELKAAYPAVQKELKGLEGELQSLGRFGEGVTNYFPRLVSDLEGLKKFLGSQHAEGLEAALRNAEAKMIRQKGRGLTDVEQALVVDRYLFKSDSSSFQPGFAKGRKIEEITPELQKFYEKPIPSLLRYISGAVTDIEQAKFFGRDLEAKKQGGKLYTDLEGSIGNLTARLLREGKITNAQAAELRDILKARFEGGNKGMSEGLAATRNLTNTALLGNVASAATQVGDSLVTIYHHGLVPTIQALAEKVIGQEKVTPKQLGLINHVAEELSEQGKTGAALHNTMKWSGFHAIDMFAKGLGLNAARIKLARQVRTPAGEVAFAEKYGPMFGDQINTVINDFKAGRVTPDVEAALFSELSDAQPISKAEMPEAYLANPNGRLLYQLKTYMLKQADVVRRDAYANIAKGDAKSIMRGAKNLAALGATYALANVPGDAIKDFVAGREVDPFSTPKLVENVLQTFGFNRYAMDKLSKGNVVDTAVGLMTPPVKIFEDIAKSAHSMLNGGSDYKALSYVPLVGRPLYDRFGYGNVRREIAERMSTPKAQRKSLSAEAKAYMRQKKAEKKAKEKY